jgi:hypothetical protein
MVYFIIYADLLTVYFSSFKVLNAPQLEDDLCFNLVDWGAQSMLSVGLGSCVGLWSARTGQFKKLRKLSSDIDSNLNHMELACKY